MTLESLLSALSDAHIPAGLPATDVRAVLVDSRQVAPETLFVAVPGTSRDGAEFAVPALAAGAVAVVGEGAPPAAVPASRWIRVSDARRAVAALAAALHRHPENSLQLYGVTGTNGKTTVATLTRAVLAECGTPCGLVSTVQADLGGRVAPADRTTPDATVLYGWLAEMVAAGCRAASIEVSSHALAQQRVAGLRFRAAAFTNLTREHLDYHGTMEAYGLAKRRLFEQLEEEPAGLAVVNRDDAWGREILAWLCAARRRVVSYGIEGPADFQVEELRCDAWGCRFRLCTPAGGVRVTSPLLGRHNVANLLAVAGLAHAAQVPLERWAATIAGQPPVRGRLERVPTAHPAALFVDYAHTPDALEHVLRTLRTVTAGRLTVVFGCGGDRDRGKRPQMGRIAWELADRVVVTSDNPRREAPQAIMDAILDGMPAGRAHVSALVDRRDAIRAALAGAARSGDVVLVAGKGHETGQVFADHTLPFDDREELRRLATPTTVFAARE